MNSTQANLFGQRLRQARDMRNLTQEEFAAQMGVAYQQIWRWESGKNDPSGDTLKRMASVLEVTTDYLLGLTHDPIGTITEEDLTPLERRLIAAVRSGATVEALEALTSLSKHGDKTVIPG